MTIRVNDAELAGIISQLEILRKSQNDPEAQYTFGRVLYDLRDARAEIERLTNQCNLLINESVEARSERDETSEAMERYKRMCEAVMAMKSSCQCPDPECCGIQKGIESVQSAMRAAGEEKAC